MNLTGRILRTMGILLGGTVIGTILLCLAFCIPVNETNRTATYEIIEEEGWYPAIPIVNGALDTYFHSYNPGVLDDSTDLIMLRAALDPLEKNVVKAAMDMNQYDRYWHGYIAILRPLLFFFDYGEIRVLNGIGQFMTMCMVAFYFWSRNKKGYFLIAVSIYFLLMPLAMPFSLQFSWVYYITVFALLYLAHEERAKKISGIHLYWMFMICGMLTGYFDLLTYPLYTWGIPVLWWIAAQEEDKSVFYYTREVVMTGLWWVLGYAGMWMSKGVIGGIILHKNLFESAFSQVAFRMGAGESDSYGLIGRFNAVYKNWKHYGYKLYVVVLVLWAIFFFLRMLQKGVRRNVKSAALALVGIAPVVWYFVLANHTEGHHFFTYRIYGISVAAVLLLLIGAIGIGKITDIRKQIEICCGWLGAYVLGCGIALLAREDILVINGYADFEPILLETNEVYEFDFIPSFPTIKSFGLCIDTDSVSGDCKVAISDENSMLYEEIIPLSSYGGNTYVSLPVNWKLDRRKLYHMQICIENADGQVFLLTTTDNNMPLSEYGNVQKDGMIYGQILSSLLYRYRPLSHFTLFFLSVTWTVILVTGYVVLYGILRHNGD